MTEEKEKELDNLIHILHIHNIDTSILFRMKDTIQKQQEEIKKKDKIIDKMAEYIRVDDIEENDNIDLCDFLGKSYSDCKHLSIACEDCIKEYFESKV